jgi:hypothetical protein
MPEPAQKLLARPKTQSHAHVAIHHPASGKHLDTDYTQRMLKFSYCVTVLALSLCLLTAGGHAFAADCPVIDITAGTFNGALNDSDCGISDVLPINDNSRVDQYRFTTTSNGAVTIGMNSTTLDASLRLYSDDLANSLAEDDDSGSGFNALLTTTLDVGTYRILANSATVATQTGSYTLTLNASTGATSSRLINIATRGRIGIDDAVLIGGLIIDGTAPKTVIIRAIGPSLANFNVAGVLADPQLQLFSGSTPIDNNDDWRQHPRAAELPTKLQPSLEQESAIVATLEPGAYTAIVSGVNAAQGVGLVEIFEANSDETMRLVNIATRGHVGTDDNVMIGGLIIQGDSPKTVVIRAKGPSLADFGVADVLANPQLQLFSGPTPIASNDDWQTDERVLDLPVSLRPTNNLESVLVRTLEPGPYTAIVSGVGGATGIGLVEVFELN